MTIIPQTDHSDKREPQNGSTPSTFPGGIYLLRRAFVLGKDIFFPWQTCSVYPSQCVREMLVVRPIGARAKRHIEFHEFGWFFFSQRVNAQSLIVESEARCG